MIAEREQVIKSLDLDSNDNVLEILTGERNFVSSMFEEIRQVETIESDPALAYSASWKSVQVRAENHAVFCGHPHVFLQQKVDNGVEVDGVIVHADRLECPRKVWSMIALLDPLWVILTYKDAGKGKYNKRLMETNGFTIMKQEGDSKNGISERFCVGRSNKCYSD